MCVWMHKELSQIIHRYVNAWIEQSLFYRLNSFCVCFEFENNFIAPPSTNIPTTVTNISFAHDTQMATKKAGTENTKNFLQQPIVAVFSRFSFDQINKWGRQKFVIVPWFDSNTKDLFVHKVYKCTPITIYMKSRGKWRQNRHHTK